MSVSASKHVGTRQYNRMYWRFFDFHPCHLLKKRKRGSRLPGVRTEPRDALYNNLAHTHLKAYIYSRLFFLEKCLEKLNPDETNVSPIPSHRLFICILSGVIGGFGWARGSSKNFNKFHFGGST